MPPNNAYVWNWILFALILLVLFAVAIRLWRGALRFWHAAPDAPPEGPHVGQVPILRRLSKEEWARVAKQWSDVFTPDKYPLGYPLSQSFPNLLTSNAALEAYRQHLAPEYIVMGLHAWWGHEGVFVTNVRPEPYPGSPSDYAVFPPNLAWTIGFTHHDFGYGECGPPHFARHPDYVRLNEENRATLEKLRHAEAETISGTDAR